MQANVNCIRKNEASLCFWGRKMVVPHINITEKKITEKELLGKKKELASLNIISRKVSSSLSLEDVIQAIIA